MSTPGERMARPTYTEVVPPSVASTVPDEMLTSTTKPALVPPVTALA